MMLWTLVFAADMAAGFTVDPKNRRKNEMVGNWYRRMVRCGGDGDFMGVFVDM